MEKFNQIKDEYNKLHFELQKKYPILTKHHDKGVWAPSIAKEVYKIFEKPGIKVIRLGLHPSEGLISGSELLAGPFHISFRELVLSQIWHDEFMKIKNTENKQSITIFVASRQFNYAIGYEAQNRKALNKQYKNVRFIKDPELQGREYYVDYC